MLQPESAFVRHWCRPIKKMLQELENNDCIKFQIICTIIVPRVYEVQNGKKLVPFLFVSATF